MTDRTPKKTPKREPALVPPSLLMKQSSNPIRIGGRKKRSGLHPRLSRPKQIAHSCPPDMRFIPPKAPSQRPRIPSIEPPPIQLPPSPPLFTEADVQREIERRKAEIEEQADRSAYLLAPVSRSLNDYHWTMSLPNHLSSGNYQPRIGSIVESPDDSKLDRPQAASYSEASSTIFSMLKETASHSGSVSPPSLTRSVSDRRDNDPLGADDADDLQFSISLKDDDDSFLPGGMGGSEQTQFSLDEFR